MERLVNIIKSHSLEKDIGKWAGLFRYLHFAFPSGFSLDLWKKYEGYNVDHNIVRALFSILEEEELVKKNNNVYLVTDDILLQRFLENTHQISTFNYEKITQKTDNLLWTMPQNQLENIPRNITSTFDYLNTSIQELIQTTNDKLIFFSPYYSVSGMINLFTSLKALLYKNSFVRITWVVNDLLNEQNQNAFDYLFKHLDSNERKQISVYKTIDDKLSFHAKLLLADNSRGYMGSANFSKRGFNTQFELGIPLDEKQSDTLTKLIEHWINTSQLKEVLMDKKS
ncbi:phospholipase D-like domain-containing protein [Thalassobacillus devorans]|uniref:phospholipase D-like domain-containing protein n=1 Tax=Thalassobacillus devorans TaxID=279813 RepID=UPI00048DA09C|nr:phospholipase D-like domain-containing protein [Thalassobacillus devorans]